MKPAAFVNMCRVLALLLVSAITSRGALLFEQPRYADELYLGLNSNTQGQQAADDFRLPYTAQITGVNWFGTHFDANPIGSHRFRLAFYHPQGASAISPAPFAQFVVVPSRSIVALNPTDPQLPSISSFSAVLEAPLIIRVGERVWLSIVDLDTSAPGRFIWSESSLGRLNAPWAARPSESEPWQVSPDGGNLAFSLTGFAVPEPCAAILFFFFAPALFRRRPSHQESLHDRGLALVASPSRR